MYQCLASVLLLADVQLRVAEDTEEADGSVSIANVGTLQKGKVQRGISSYGCCWDCYLGTLSLDKSPSKTLH